MIKDLAYREASARRGNIKPQQLVIMLHGYGSYNGDLIALAPELAEFLPNAHFVSPNAPSIFEEGGELGYQDAYQWFSLVSREESFMLKGAREAEPILNNFIDQQLDRFNLTAKQLIVIGFSQGTMMTLHTMLRRSEPAACLIGFSGMLLGGNLLPKEIKSRPPTLLVHGAEDRVLFPEVMAHSEKSLIAAGVPTTTLLCPRLGHGIDRAGIWTAGEFMRNNI
jgi:phospholipase/carboxylesterase